MTISNFSVINDILCKGGRERDIHIERIYKYIQINLKKSNSQDNMKNQTTKAYIEGFINFYFLNGIVSTITKFLFLFITYICIYY